MDRDRIWPVGLVVFFVCFIGMVVGFVIWSTFHRSELVYDDYYAREVAYQDRIDQMERARALPELPAWSYEPGGPGLRLRFSAGLRGTELSGVLELFRPADRRLDRRIDVRPDADGEQWVPGALASGLWLVKLEWISDGVSYYLEKPLTAP